MNVHQAVNAMEYLQMKAKVISNLDVTMRMEQEFIPYIFTIIL